MAAARRAKPSAQRLAAAIALAALAAASGSARGAVHAGRAGVDATPAAGAPLVRLDVAVRDAKGHPVGDLKPSDFELIVDGAPQPLDAVTPVRIDPASPTGAAPRPFAIFLDEYHTGADAAARIRGALTRFVDEQLGPRDPVVVMKPLDSLLTIPLAKNRDEVRDAVASFEGRQGDYEPRNAFERDYMGRAPAVIERLRRQVTVSALNALVVRLGPLTEGRKAILLVSEGFAAGAPVRGEERLPTIQSLVRAANRQNVAIYTLNPAAAAAGAEVLRTLASSTDGGSAAGDDDVDAALRRIAVDSSAYYLLTCRPAVAADGRFHAVEVHVRRRGVRARTRTGFWAITPEDVARAARAAEAAAHPTPALDLVPRHISPLISPWFGMSRGAEGRTRITFVWEPARRVPGDRTRGSRPARVSIRATAPDGATVYDGVVAPTGAVMETANAAAKAVFEAQPGTLRLRMAIAGDNAKELDVDTRDLAIRDLRQPVAIGTPEVLRARSALEFRTLAADADAAPVAAREFSRAERLLIRFAVYAPAGDRAVVGARLVSRAGSTMRAFEATAAGEGETRQIDVPLAGFAPGEYAIELSVSTGGGAAKELLNFRVTG